MRRVDRWECGDGSVWTSEARARDRDVLIAEASAFIASLNLKPIPKGGEFSNGAGYVQQPAGSRDMIVGWAKSKGWNRDTDGPVGRVAYRAHCTDHMDREWGQPYFALNPTKGKQFEVATNTETEQ